MAGQRALLSAGSALPSGVEALVQVAWRLGSVTSGAFLAGAIFIELRRYQYAISYSSAGWLLVLIALACGLLFLAGLWLLLPRFTVTGRLRLVGPAVLVLSIALLAVGSLEALRTAGDYVSLKQWRDGRSVREAWHSNYESRYLRALSETQLAEASLDALLNERINAGRTDEESILLRAFDGLFDPAQFFPSRPPDVVSWRVRNVRIGSFEFESVAVGEAIVRWNYEPFVLELPGHEGIPRLQSVEVREILGLSSRGGVYDWNLIEATVEVGGVR